MPRNLSECEREIKHVVEMLTCLKTQGDHCVLFIGAGCSVSGGIPLASEFVDMISQQFPLDYEKASPKKYAECMGQIGSNQRRKLVQKYIGQAKINWAHMAIAALIAAGYVDRVLTVNFDPLLMQACFLLGVYPAIFDYASAPIFQAENVPSPSIFYLHGQHTGFVLMNTAPKMREHAEVHFPSVFADAGRNRMWIVAGYSGEDPAFKSLASQDFPNRLYWVGHSKDDPPAHVQNELLGKEDTFFLRGQDADEFFVTVAQSLKCFPPEIIRTPFSYLERLFEHLTNADQLRGVREVVQQAKKQFETELSDVERKAETKLLEGENEDVIQLIDSQSIGPLSPRLASLAALALRREGDKRLRDAEMAEGEDAELLYEAAVNNYARALELEPDTFEALYSWANALMVQGKNRVDENAGPLFEQAAAKYEEALRLRPKSYDALSNCGRALLAQARLRAGAKACVLLEQAARMYRQALVVKPNDYRSANFLGVALYEQARMKGDDEADRLLQLAGEEFSKALSIKPGLQFVVYNWARALSEQASRKSGEEAKRLSELAAEKYQRALAAESKKPDNLAWRDIVEGAGQLRMTELPGLKAALKAWMDRSGHSMDG